NPNVFLETNILGVQSLLSACRKNKAALFVQISTDEVYGSLETCQNPSEETDILCPSSVYSASKASAEMLCFAAMKTFNQPIIITRS
ncbi:GDP-mannose 4,6-dehydratase, partial [Streptomyces caeruleatus]